MNILRIHLEAKHERIIDTYAERDGVGKAEAIRRMIDKHDVETDLSSPDGPRRPKRCTGVHLGEQHIAKLEAIGRRYGLSKGEAARRIIGCYRLAIQAPPPSTLGIGDAAAAH